MQWKKTGTRQSHVQFAKDSKAVVDSQLPTTENNNKEWVYQYRMMIVKEISSMKSEYLLRHIYHFPFPVENRNRGYPIRKHSEINLEYMDALYRRKKTV